MFMEFFRKIKDLFEKKDIFYIGGSQVLPPPLSNEQEAECLKNIRKNENRACLIEHNLRLVVYIARKFENTGVGVEDLISIGTIGLIKAVNTFNPEKNIKLATYASRCIENEILMFLRKNSNTRQEISINDPLNTDYDGNELMLSDVLGSDADAVGKSLDDEVDKQLLSVAMSRLSVHEKEIMCLRYGLLGGQEKTQKEVADHLGISQSYISRLEKRIILRLKKEMDKMTE